MSGEDAESDLPPIAVTSAVADAGVWSKKLSITVPAEEVGKFFDAAAGEWAGQVQLPGFRQGKVPRGLAEKRFGPEIRKQVTQEVVARAF